MNFLYLTFILILGFSCSQNLLNKKYINFSIFLKEKSISKNSSLKIKIKFFSYKNFNKFPLITNISPYILFFLKKDKKRLLIGPNIKAKINPQKFLKKIKAKNIYTRYLEIDLSYHKELSQGEYQLYAIYNTIPHFLKYYNELFTPLERKELEKIGVLKSNTVEFEIVE